MTYFPALYWKQIVLVAKDEYNTTAPGERRRRRRESTEHLLFIYHHKGGEVMLTVKDFIPKLIIFILLEIHFCTLSKKTKKTHKACSAFRNITILSVED